MRYFLGVDVGTGSARAGVVSESGSLRASAVCPIRLWKYDGDCVEQSSADIWAAVCQCVREAVEKAGIMGSEIAGIGFDATCSLVVLDTDFQPLAVNREGDPERNIIVWMDHRAAAEAEFINQFSEEEVLRFLGGKISLEMEIPKLLWLKRHLPETWKKAAHYFDLPDFLTFRATGDTTRSLCSTVCKWTYRGDLGFTDERGWDAAFFRRIGLEDLGAARIGQSIRPMGEAIPGGLSERAASEMNLRPGIPVGVSIIDAHAGGIGTIGMQIGADETIDLDRRLALIGGTSSCHMAVSAGPRFIGGIWGPYFSAMIPGLWLNEGGQSATGALVDFIIENHGAFSTLREEAEVRGISVYERLNAILEELGGEHPESLTENLHVCPYFHGNRSPRANPALRGMISGLSLAGDLRELARLYLATIQAIACGTRHIIEECNRSGYAIDTIIMCGGGTKNPVFLREHANMTGCRVVLPEEPEAVLVGSAILGAVAGGAFPTIEAAMSAMSRPGAVLPPDGRLREFCEGKYAVFRRMYEDQMAYAAIMQNTL